MIKAVKSSIFSINSNKEKKNFFANTSWVLFERICQMIISLFIGAASARYLGPVNYGMLNYSMSIIAIFASITSLGLEGILIKEILITPKDSGKILGSSILMRIIASILSIIAINICIYTLNPNDYLILIIGVYQSIHLLFKSFEVIDFWFQSQLKSKYVVIAKIVAMIVVAMWKILLLIFGYSVKWFALSITIETIIIAVMLTFMYYNHGGVSLTASWTMCKKLITQSYHFILVSLCIVIYSQIDKIMIGQMLDKEMVGLYSAAITISQLWFFIPNAIINSARPLIMEAKNKSEEVYIKRLKQLYSVIIWMGVSVSITFLLIGKYIIWGLYGKSYIQAAIPLSINVWAGIFALLGTVRGIWIICENYTQYSKYYIVIGSIVNIILNYILIPIYGINGAAFATLMTQTTVALGAPLLFSKTRISPVHMISSLNLFKVFNLKFDRRE